MRAPEVAKWQQKYRVDWDATHGVKWRSSAKAEEQGAVALVLDLAKAFERVSLLVVWAWATHFSFPKVDLACAVRALLNTRGECSSKEVRQSRSQPSLLSCQDPCGIACFYVLYCRIC